jgi:hypothetical protein
MHPHKTRWTPQADDAMNLATIRWYGITLERLLIEMYSTNRHKWPGLQERLNQDLKDLYDYFKSPDFADEDECPPGQTMCSDGLCAAQCERFE